MNTELKNTKTNPRFVGLIMAFLLPGIVHVMSGQWKTGIAWYCGLFALFGLSVFALSIPVTLSFTTVVTIELFIVTLFVIYFISLFVSSYRPTRRLGYKGWFIFLLLVGSFNLIVNDYFVWLVKWHIARIFWLDERHDNMYPTLKTPPSYWADRVSVSKFSYRFGNPRRGDIILVDTNESDGFWFSRIVGLPGETVDICTPHVLINGEKLLDPPIFAKISSLEEGYFGYVNLFDDLFAKYHDKLMDLGVKRLPITLGPDEYFLLGDNRHSTLDSRIIGPVTREAIIGQVTRIVFPPWRITELTMPGSYNEGSTTAPLDSLPREE